MPENVMIHGKNTSLQKDSDRSVVPCRIMQHAHTHTQRVRKYITQL